MALQMSSKMSKSRRRERTRDTVALSQMWCTWFTKNEGLVFPGTNTIQHIAQQHAFSTAWAIVAFHVIRKEIYPSARSREGIQGGHVWQDTPYHTNTGKYNKPSHHKLLPQEFTTEDHNKPPLMDGLLQLIEKDPDHTQYGVPDQVAIPYLQYRALTVAQNTQAPATFKHSAECADSRVIGQDHNTAWIKPITNPRFASKRRPRGTDTLPSTPAQNRRNCKRSCYATSV